MPSTYVGVAESTVPTARLDAESVIFGTTTVFRERIQIAGVTSGSIAPVTSDAGLLVNISSLSTLQLSTVSIVRVEPVSSGTMTVTGTSNVSGSTVILTTGSVVRVEPVSSGTMTVTGTSNIAGNTTAIVSTVSAIRVKSTATLTVTGTSNVSGSTVLANSRIQSSQILSGSTLVAVQYAQFTFATTGGQTIVSSVAGAIVRVLGMNLVCASTTVLTWFSDTTAGTTLSGPQSFAANGGLVLPTNAHGWFQTTAGAPLTLKSEAASSVGGSVTYAQSTAFV